jgi:hypothetical protein
VPQYTSAGHTGSLGFAGYALESGPYQKVVGHFTQPSVISSNGEYFSNWIGLNGTTQGTNDRLIQAGVDTKGTPFWEDYCSPAESDCNGPVGNHSVNVPPGAVVSVAVWYVPATNISNYQVAVNGTLVINTPWAMIDTAHTGDIADFLSERPGTNPIPVFGTVVWNSARTYAVYNSSTVVWFGSQRVYSYEMTPDGSFYTPSCVNPILIYPASITSEGFTNYFCNTSG